MRKAIWSVGVALMVLTLAGSLVLAADTKTPPTKPGTAAPAAPAKPSTPAPPAPAGNKGPQGHPAGCATCHVPHSAAGEKLWPYAPPTTTTKGTQLSAGSALCYSCHDGTLTSLGATFFEKDGNTHPIDVVPSDRVKVPKEFPLDAKGRITCATCHNPHKTAYDKYLRMPADNGELCVACHINN